MLSLIFKFREQINQKLEVRKWRTASAMYTEKQNEQTYHRAGSTNRGQPHTLEFKRALQERWLGNVGDGRNFQSSSLVSITHSSCFLHLLAVHLKLAS